MGEDVFADYAHTIIAAPQFVAKLTDILTWAKEMLGTSNNVGQPKSVTEQLVDNLSSAGKAERNDYALEDEQDDQGINFLKTSSGSVLGFEPNGEIYLLSEDPKTLACAARRTPRQHTKRSEPPRRSPCGAARL